MNESKAAKNPSPDTSEAILRAATTLFSQKGINGTTTREIADLAGVNIAGLHYHWGGKEDLLKAVYQRVIEELMGLVARIFDNPAAHLKENIETHLGRFHDFFIENAEYARILLYGDLEKPTFIAELRDRYILPIVRQVSEQMKSLMREKKIRKIDPEAMLLSMYGSLLVPFADFAAQKACMGDTILNKKIAQRFRRQFIDSVLSTLGLEVL
ncbi:MAG TPA: TetR/AcrR family transcriptional regulator [bacterium]|nr:TetR/AcrR family transcriptional regulator [bacterium]